MWGFVLGPCFCGVVLGVLSSLAIILLVLFCVSFSRSCGLVYDHGQHRLLPGSILFAISAIKEQKQKREQERARVHTGKFV